MNNKIQKIKKELIIIFTAMVFFIIFFLGITYFSAKYFKEISIEKSNFLNLLNIVENGNISLDNIIRFQNKFDNDIFNKKEIENNKVVNPISNILKTRGFINYVFFDKDDSIVSSNIKDNITKSLVSSIKEDDSFFNSKQTGGFLVRKFRVTNNNGTFIILKKLRYNFNDYINDILGYMFISLLFSLILYFIGTKFVNKVFIPVEENMKDMKDFIHNAGHELKTPISVIDSNIQLLDEMKIYDKKMTKELKKEVLRINSIIESLIKLSDIDLFKDLEKNNLENTIEEIISELKSKIKEKQLNIKINIDKKVEVMANKDYFYIFLSNIIGNAIKYNKNKGDIDILHKSSELIIKDSGIGIKKDDLNKIFSRFFKADKSRNSEGFGIGLSLVRKIADIYKWNIKVESKEGKGTTFRIKF